MATIGRKLLSSIVYSADIQEMLSLNLSPDLFKDSENLLFDFIYKHIQKHGKIPSQITIEETPGFEEALVEAPEPPGFYLEGVEKRYLQTSLKGFMNEAAAHMKDTDQDPEKAFDILLNGVSRMNMHRNRKNLFDFRDAAELIYDEYVKQKTLADEYGLMFGWESVDAKTGGAKPGDFISFVGRPASGKTFKLLYNALNAWHVAKPPLFVSMEMAKIIIMQRLAAMHTHKPLTHIMKAEMTTKAFSAMMDLLVKAQSKTAPLWVVDGNLSQTVDDVLMLCRQLKPAALYVDGAYLLRNQNSKMSRFERQTENAEQLKQRIATDLGIPVVASYQFGKQVGKMKKAKGEKAGMDDVYGSDAIAQLSTMMFGLMQEDSVETQKTREIEILKGRNGETGRFKINWDFIGMNFSECSPEGENASLDYCD